MYKENKKQKVAPNYSLAVLKLFTNRILLLLCLFYTWGTLSIEERMSWSKSYQKPDAQRNKSQNDRTVCVGRALKDHRRAPSTCRRLPRPRRFQAALAGRAAPPLPQAAAARGRWAARPGLTPRRGEAAAAPPAPNGGGRAWPWGRSAGGASGREGASRAGGGRCGPGGGTAGGAGKSTARPPFGAAVWCSPGVHEG